MQETFQGKKPEIALGTREERNKEWKTPGETKTLALD